MRAATALTNGANSPRQLKLIEGVGIKRRATPSELESKRPGTVMMLKKPVLQTFKEHLVKMKPSKHQKSLSQVDSVALSALRTQASAKNSETKDKVISLSKAIERGIGRRAQSVGRRRIKF